MNCPNCEKVNSETALLCDQCGTSLTPQICPKCEHENSSTAVFCENCGQSFKEEPDNTPQTSPTPQQTNCPSCGTLNPQTSKFCQSCGYPLQSAQSPMVKPVKVKAKKTGGLHPLLAFLYGILGTVSILALIYLVLALSSIF